MKYFFYMAFTILGLIYLLLGAVWIGMEIEETKHIESVEVKGLCFDHNGQTVTKVKECK